MAMSIVPLFTGLTGINDKVDPVRHKYDPDTGMGELEAAVNCDIDETGQISRRAGQLPLDASAYLSVFCDGGDCFAQQDRTIDAAIMQVGTDFSLTGVRSGLVKGERMGFCQVGDRTYYSSTSQNGVITGGISAPWPSAANQVLETERVFYNAPLGPHLAYFDGHFLIAVDNVIWISEKWEPGKFRMGSNFWQMGTRVRMIKPVLGGIWLSDEEGIGFVPAGQPGQLLKDSPFIPKAAYPAHEWSESIELIDFTDSALQIPGESAVWSSNVGLCIGTADGRLVVPTEDKLYYPAGDMGATVKSDGLAIVNSVW